MTKPAFDLSLYFVTDPDLVGSRGVEGTVASAIDGGVTMVQLRDKAAPAEALTDLARRLVALLRPHGIPLIINDRIDVALAADADGVHVGQEDMPAAEVRERIGNDRILGVSVANLEEARAVDWALADYAGLGPFKATLTKVNHARPLGSEGFREVRAALPLPVVGIGGIDSGNAASVIRAGADGIAVVSAICTAADPAAAARSLIEIVQAARQEEVK